MYTEPHMPPAPITPEQTRRFLVILWVAMFVTVPVYYFISGTVRADNANPDSPLVYPLLGVGILMVLASFYIKAGFGSKVPRSIALVRMRYIIALVLTEVPAILGLVVYVVSAWPNAWVFFVISAGGYILNFPVPRDFEGADNT